MKKKGILFYLASVILFLVGNRDLWDELCDFARHKEVLKEQAKVNDDIEKRFEVQKLHLDTITNKLKNPAFYFQLVGLGNVNFKATKKVITRVEHDDDENASDSH